MRSRSSSLSLALVVATLMPGCAAGMSRLKSGISGKPGMMSMPDLFRMSKAKAITTLKLAGHTGDVRWDDQLCGSVVDGKIIEKGEVCRQTPAAGQETSAQTLVTILVQPEDPRHGKVGQFGEWHLMPDVIGMPLDRAQVAMREAGFTDDKTHVDESDDSTCKPRIVCRSYPQALERTGQASDRYLTVGADPTARTTRPTRPEPEPDPEAKPEPKPEEPPPPPSKPESYF